MYSVTLAWRMTCSVMRSHMTLFLLSNPSSARKLVAPMLDRRTACNVRTPRKGAHIRRVVLCNGRCQRAYYFKVLLCWLCWYHGCVKQWYVKQCGARPVAKHGLQSVSAGTHVEYLTHLPPLALFMLPIHKSVVRCRTVYVFRAIGGTAAGCVVSGLHVPSAAQMAPWSASMTCFF